MPERLPLLGGRELVNLHPRRITFEIHSKDAARRPNVVCRAPLFAPFVNDLHHRAPPAPTAAANSDRRIDPAHRAPDVGGRFSGHLPGVMSLTVKRALNTCGFTLYPRLHCSTPVILTDQLTPRRPRAF